MKRLLSYLTTFVLVVAIAGCRDLGTGPADSLTGSYDMRTLDGQRLPATLYYNNSSDHIEVLSSQLVLRSDGSYEDLTRLQDTNYGTTTVYDDATEGSWQLSGSELTLTDLRDANHVTYAYVTNGRITIDHYAGYDATAEFVR